MTKKPTVQKDLDASEYSRVWDKVSNYKEVKSQPDKRFGDIMIKKSNSGETIFQKSKTYNSKKTATQAILDI